MRAACAGACQPHRGPCERQLHRPPQSGAALLLPGASGGHSHIVLVEHYGEYRLLGQTLDDAAGEAFDKVARVLDIPYPGGPLLDKLAEEGDDGRYRFPHTHTPGKYDFSFSGLKTAVINQAHNLRQQVGNDQRCRLCRQLPPRRGGSAGHKERGRRRGGGGGFPGCRGRRGRQPPVAPGAFAPGRRGRPQGLSAAVALCTDNAAMIGAAAFYRLMRGEVAALDLNALPSLRMFA